MENKYNCNAYDSGYCYCLSKPLTDEEDDKCEDYCCACCTEDGKKEKYMDEKYYWKKEDGTLVPVHELTRLHICNIVMKFGKDRLREMGHTVIVDKFESLNKKYKFFDIVSKEFKST